MDFKTLLKDKIVQQELKKEEYNRILEDKIDKNCPCTCCEDALARLGKRNLLDACWCFMSKEEEQCHCKFCQMVKEFRKSLDSGR